MIIIGSDYDLINDSIIDWIYDPIMIDLYIIIIDNLLIHNQWLIMFIINDDKSS